jgi:hypothetical protein
MKEVNVTGEKAPLLSMLGEPERYDYATPTDFFKKASFYPILKNQFKRLGICHHLESSSLRNSLPVLMTKRGYEIFFLREDVHDTSKKRKNRELKLLCPECYARIESIGCEEGITRRRSFVFEFICPVERVLLQSLLEKNGIPFMAPELERYGNDRSITMHLNSLDVLITNEREIRDHVEKLKPKFILTFGTRKDLFNYLGLGVNVLIFDDSPEASERWLLFDKDKQVEDSLEKVIQAIISKLDTYAEEIRGKEHDRLIEAFNKIGSELGFVSQREFTIKGGRIDVAWLDRQGNVHVAIEAETSPTWKKDVVTTWEAQPQTLSVVLVHDKTNRGIRNLIEYALLQTMPHKLLFINYEVKRAYLLEKQEILKCYDIKKKSEIPKTEFLEV